VFSKKPFAGPKQVLDYIGRYTHRVAISNNRIVDVQDDMVTFSYRDRKDNNTLKLTTVDSEDSSEGSFSCASGRVHENKAFWFAGQ